MTTAALPNRSTTPLPTGPDFGRGPLAIYRAVRLFSNDQLEAFKGLVKTYGHTFLISLAGTQSLIISKPEHMHAVLVENAESFHKDQDYKDTERGLARFAGMGLLTSDGALWKRQRKLVAPALHAKRIAAYAETMVEYSGAMLGRWRDGVKLDIAREMSALTIRIVGKTLFDVDATGEQAETMFEAMSTAQDLGGRVTLLPTWIPTPTELRRRRTGRALDALVYAMIKNRRASGVDHGDLLSMLVAARDENGETMDVQQIRDEAVTLFLAGHETTANALNWTFMLLAQHPEVETKLHEEIDRVLGSRLPTLADLDALRYTDQVVKESMRLYPPAWSVGRVAIEDVQVGEYLLPKGTRVGALIYFTHRDPALWPDAEHFDPDRFSPEHEPTIPRYAYLPFGGGPRICIGNHFAMMEAKLLLATIASRYALRLTPGQQVETSARVTLNPKDGLPMTLVARK